MDRYLNLQEIVSYTKEYLKRKSIWICKKTYGRLMENQVLIPMADRIEHRIDIFTK